MSALSLAFVITSQAIYHLESFFSIREPSPDCQSDGVTRDAEQYHINALIESEIAEILATPITDASLQMILDQIRTSEVASEVERKRVQNFRISRPNQAKFRHDVLAACQRYIITNVTMPEVLEAAHIKPFKYNGEDTIANGFAMRTDIHTLFDAAHLHISEQGWSNCLQERGWITVLLSTANCTARLYQPRLYQMALGEL